MDQALPMERDEEAPVLDSIQTDWIFVDLDRPSPTIFLSHSGAQKNFVEQLCEDLEQAKQFPFFDKRTHSLPKGEEFAPLIFTAARECELAVVVISEHYFTRSKWPMLELAAIVQAPGCKILPLFFGLSCKEFKKPKRRNRWFQLWEEWSKLDNRICVDLWKEALRTLDGRNGIEYVNATGEVAYRKEIVTIVCKSMQRRSQERIVVKTTALDACGFDMHQQHSGATRIKRFMFESCTCLHSTLMFSLKLVAALFVLLLLHGRDDEHEASTVSEDVRSTIIEFSTQEGQPLSSSGHDVPAGIRRNLLACEFPLLDTYKSTSVARVATMVQVKNGVRLELVVRQTLIVDNFDTAEELRDKFLTGERPVIDSEKTPLTADEFLMNKTLGLFYSQEVPLPTGKSDAPTYSVSACSLATKKSVRWLRAISSAAGEAEIFYSESLYSYVQIMNDSWLESKYI